MKFIKPLLHSLFVSMLIWGCGSTADIISTPVENIDNTPLKISDLTEAEERNWGHLDLVNDTIPGMSVDRAYSEIIKGRKGTTTIVAIIDSAIDIDHEDLDDVIWKNEDEIADNGKDDDNNGYIDDVYGWNFLGDTEYEQMEFTRLVVSGNTNHPRFAEAKTELQEESSQALQTKTQYEQTLRQIIMSDNAIVAHLEKPIYTQDEVNSIQTDDQMLLQHINIINQVYGFGVGSISETKSEFEHVIKYFTERLNYHFNKDFRGRKTDDDPGDISDRSYGNNNVRPITKDESHGTHVSGIVGAERNNGIGINGVANNVRIMPLRTIPNGDEYDKDVALAIRYAVDNGAKIINASFGKYYSPNADWVKEAITYAGQKDVLIVSGSGNEGFDIDEKLSFPNDLSDAGGEISGNFVSVGAIDPRYGSEMVASYSNYGKRNVDVFAPGTLIYSTIPENDYKNLQGTSMASPGVAGVAALIRSQFPTLTAVQVKQILKDSGLPIKTRVIVGGDPSNVKAFEELSTSGKIVNAYNALIMASKMAKK
jgi:subtilisin family serine protease